MKKLILICAVALICLSAVIIPLTCSADTSTTAQSAVLMERTSGRILYAKNENERLPMASTTKIMTALVVAENCAMDDVVEVPSQAVGIEGSSIYLRQGEHLTVKELLYGLMLQSGNDSAAALAIHTAGSIEKFADMMNAKAEALGLKDSHFVNPHGLHDDAHYTTAHDLGVISCAALNNEDIRGIVATPSVKISNEGYDYDRVINNKNKLLKNYTYGDGVKTGYTKKAGRCFVGSATKDGMQLVAVVLKCGPMFEECRQMMEQGFEKYSMINIIPKNKMCGAVYSRSGPSYYYCDKSFAYPLAKGEEKLITKKITLPEQAGETGTIEVFLDKQLIFSEKLVTI